MEEREKEIILRTYSSVWKIDRKIYSIEGMKLLFPVAINEFVYLGISIMITFLLIKIIPPLGNLHFIFKYLMLPFGLMKLFTTIKLDGKMAHKFVIDYIIFIFGPKTLCRFKHVDSIGEKLEFKSVTHFVNMKIVNKTEEAIKGRRGKRVRISNKAL